ncbi:MAG: CarD family transcriptional regulator [Firmicutes bacterium]|nr:CarD family transcriptional regulator [Bacillota bacterium]
MFNKGDKIVYPIYGAGIIESLEEKEIDGSLQLYYVMRIPIGNLKIVISADKVDSLGIRAIYTIEKINAIMQTVKSLPIDMPENWSQRYKENMSRIRTGKLEEISLVYRNLYNRERVRGLSTAEKKIMTTARQIIVSEIILVQEIEKFQAEEVLLKMFDVGIVENSTNFENIPKPPESESV